MSFTARALIQQLDAQHISPLGQAVALLIWSGEVEATSGALHCVFGSRHQGALRKLLATLEHAVPSLFEGAKRAERRGGYITTTHTTTDSRFESEHRNQGTMAPKQKTTVQEAETETLEQRECPNGTAARSATQAGQPRCRMRRGTDAETAPEEVVAIARRFAGYLETVSDTDLAAGVWQVWLKYPHRRQVLHEIAEAALVQTAAKERAGEIRVGTLKYLCGTMLEMSRLGTWRKPPGGSRGDRIAAPAETGPSTVWRPDRTSPRATTPARPVSPSHLDPATVTWDMDDSYGDAVADIWLFTRVDWRMVLTNHWDGRAYMAVKALCATGGVKPGVFREALKTKAAQSESSAFYWARRLATAANLERELATLLNEVELPAAERPENARPERSVQAQPVERQLITPENRANSWGKGSLRSGPGWSTGPKSKDFSAYAEVDLDDEKDERKTMAEPICVCDGVAVDAGEFVGSFEAAGGLEASAERSTGALTTETVTHDVVGTAEQDSRDAERLAQIETDRAAEEARLEADRLVSIESDRVADQARMEAEEAVRVEAKRVRQAEEESKAAAHRERWQACSTPTWGKDTRCTKLGKCDGLRSIVNLDSERAGQPQIPESKKEKVSARLPSPMLL